MSADGSFDISAAEKKKEESTKETKKSEPPASAGAGAAAGAGEAAKKKEGDDEEKAEGEESGDGSGGAVPINKGGVTDRYSWSQSLADVSLTFPLPPGIKSKDLDITINKADIKVAIKGGAGGGKVLLSGPLYKKVKIEDSTWTIEDDDKRPQCKLLSVYLAKENGMEWWPLVAEGEPKIDVSKVRAIAAGRRR